MYVPIGTQCRQRDIGTISKEPALIITVYRLTKYILSWGIFLKNTLISVEIVSGPTEVNFQPISACGGSISVADTVSDH